MKEGEWHSFILLKEATLAGDEACYILLDLQSTRYILPARFYRHYQWKPGETITCRVDKINCTGRIFLEPKHPVYEEGKTYPFEFLREEKREEVTGERVSGWVFKDALGKESYSPVDTAAKPPRPGCSIECRVERIKKGMLYLKHSHSLQPADRLLPHEWYPFRISGFTKNEEGDVLWILEDSWGFKHLLKKKHFPFINAGLGEVLRLQAVKRDFEGHWVLEPRHPVYSEGETHFFNIIEFRHSTENHALISEIKVQDCFQNEILVELPEGKAMMGFESSIQLKVTELRKGRPVLCFPD